MERPETEARVHGELVAILPPPNQGHCPGCAASLDGGGIWLHFFHTTLDETKDEEAAVAEADRVAEMYGADRTQGRWGRSVGLVINDRTTHYGCPSCGVVWDRNTGQIDPDKGSFMVDYMNRHEPEAKIDG